MALKPMKLSIRSPREPQILYPPSFSPISVAKSCKFCKRCNGCDKDDCPERCSFYTHVWRSEPFCSKCEGHIVDGVIVCYDCSKTVIEKPGLCHGCIEMWKLEELKEKLKKMQLKEQTISAIPPRRKLTRESAKAPPYVGLRRTCPDCSAVTKIAGFCDECFECF